MSRAYSSLHCLFSYDNKLGGSVHAALNVCKYLARADQPVEVVASYQPGDDIGYLQTDYAEVPCHQVQRSFPRRYCNSRELSHWLGRNLHRFDVVELHGIFVMTTLRAARSCIKLGLPYYVHPHGSLDPFDLQKHRWLKRIVGPLYVRWLLHNAAGVVCTSQLESDRLVTYGAKPRRLVMPLPVPLSDKVGNGAAFRQRHGIPGDAQVVLFMSRIDYKKGLDFLIPALARLKPELPRLWFVLAGTGSENFVQRVHGWISDHGLRSFTSEVGFVGGQEKMDALAAADIFALPSRNENFGIVNIEAMHAGVPLLISDEVYISREIAEAGAGMICRPSIESVTDILRQMLHGAVDLKAMGQRGRALVQRSYRPEAATATLIKLYAQTAESAIHHDEPGLV